MQLGGSTEQSGEERGLCRGGPGSNHLTRSPHHPGPTSPPPLPPRGSRCLLLLPAGRWRSRLSNTRRKRVDGEEYMEMAAGIPNSSASPSGGGGAVPVSSLPAGPPAGPAVGAAPAGAPAGYGSGGHGFGPGAYSGGGGGRGAYSSASAAPPSVVVVARSEGYGVRSWADREREEREKRAPGGWGY